MKKYLLIFSFYLIITNVCAQDKPKLIVGIVVDQMRYDMLTRLKSNFGKGGFRRLMDHGFFAENMMYNYAPTYTAPGHSSIYTGTTPAVHGIAGNNWLENYDKPTYCTDDETVTTTGIGTDKNGKMSPRRLKTTTIGDQMKLASDDKAIVIGIALKDRGAILPTGHMGDEAYWYDSKMGNWISSSYYMDTLPQWVNEFNNKKYPQNLLKDGWNLLLSPSRYQSIHHDSNDWEGAVGGKPTATIPYRFSQDNMLEDIKSTPFGNTMTSKLVLEALRHTSLGRDNVTDLLAVSFSSTDYVGHETGPYSLESEDTYYRLDRDIEELLNEVDIHVGKDNYWVFLTADHGVQDVPKFANQFHIPAGITSEKNQITIFNEYLNQKLGKTDIIKKIMNEQITLNRTTIAGTSITAESVAQSLNQMDVKNLEGIVGFYDFEHLQNAPLPQYIRTKLINGYCPRRSGDIALLLEPGYMSHGNKGTTHGSPYSHDSHIPFIFYGKNVKAHTSANPYAITDIAPTISYLLGILQPNGCTGNPIPELQYLK